jgi:hypothetical protein
MKRALLSICIGCVLTWLLFLYVTHPRSGPTPVVIIIIPFQLLASAITKDRMMGEIVFYSLIISFMSLLAYAGFRLIAAVRKDRHH